LSAAFHRPRTSRKPNDNRRRSDRNLIELGVEYLFGLPATTSTASLGFRPSNLASNGKRGTIKMRIARHENQLPLQVYYKTGYMARND
jgi:hypothetical protein